MTSPSHIRIGSRKSPLAIRQAEICSERLQSILPDDIKIEIHTFQTSGDAYLAGNLSEIGNKGLFTKEIERALLENQIDIAVHSMKDVATTLPDGLIIPSVLMRDNVYDALLCSTATSIETLPRNATVGTSSLRRAVQLTWQRPDLHIVEYRGNIQRRMERLESGTVDATLLAMAGLERMQHIPQYATPLTADSMLPAVAQGAIGLQCREEDNTTHELLLAINHAPTLYAIETERHLLARLDGSCRTPIAGLATISNNTITLDGLLAATDASWLHREQMSADIKDRITMADALAEQLLSLQPR